MHLFGTSPADVQHKIEVLDRHCENEGRDPATIRKTILGFGNPLDDIDAFLAGMQEYARLGVDLVEVMAMSHDPVGLVSALGEKVVPRLAEIGAA